VVFFLVALVSGGFAISLASFLSFSISCGVRLHSFRRHTSSSVQLSPAAYNPPRLHILQGKSNLRLSVDVFMQKAKC
jgi:hypothetical protein